MKLLIVSQYFWPESFIINDLVKNFIEDGHEVTVLTAKPNYPDGEIFSGYHKKGVIKEKYLDSVDVFRVPIYPRGKGGGRSLSLNYLSFVLSGLIRFPNIVRKREFDSILVFGVSPITAAIPAIPLKFMTKTRLAIWVQDLWPESISATGFIHSKAILTLIGLMVRGIYFFTDTILVQSKGFCQPVSRYADSSKIVYYPNSIDERVICRPVDKENLPLPKTLVETLENKFCVVFAGNLGIAQSLETICDAASRLRDLEDLTIVLVGKGSMLDFVRKEKEEKKLDNMVLAGHFAMEDMPAIYERSSALLVTLRDEEIFSYTVPSKVQAYLAAEKPIIASLNGEGARVIEESQSGLTCPAQDGEALADSIRELYGMPREKRLSMAENGKRYFERHFSMARQSKRLIEILGDKGKEIATEQI